MHCTARPGRSVAAVGALHVFLDRFIPLDMLLGELLEMIEEDPLKLFDRVRAIVDNEVKGIQDVKLYRRYFDPKEIDVVVEYLVKGGFGKLSVKLIYSEAPARALFKYYESEKKAR